jgi:asparagine synthase (glutamine-hydrolysing)
MCGIAGLLRLPVLSPTDSATVKTMTDCLAHRGPDGSGHYVGEGVVHGHRRLSIIDLATGDQPFLSADRQLALVYNGELYNYLEIRAELKALGRTFRSESDTEVILQAYEEWGTDCLAKFNGMWAFALWDARTRSLFCARDRLGEKPFFYAEHAGAFVFGSEIKALFAAGQAREVDEEVLDAILCFGYLPAPYTTYKGVRKLPAGCYLIAKGGRVEVRRYWQMPSFPAEALRTDVARIHEEFAALFADSVRLRMRSDVPVGAFLSGGLDSAAVVAAMSRESQQRVRTCTIGFDGGTDERHLARLVAQRFNTEHSEAVVGREDAEALLHRLAWHFDEPFADTSSLPSYVVSRIARELVTVVLTGDGGDEVLGGYPVHQSEKLASFWQRLAPPIRVPLGKVSMAALDVASAAGIRGAQRARRVLDGAEGDFVSRLERKQIGFSAAQRTALLGGNARVRPAREFIAEALASCQARDGIGLLNFWLHTVALPERYLCKVDRSSMAHSLEARVPFLDPRLVELMAGVSAAVKMPKFTRKAVLRETLGRELPPALLTAAKRGFDPPLAAWVERGGTDWPAILRPLEQAGLFVSAALSEAGRAAPGGRPPMGLWALSMLAVQLAAPPRAAAAPQGAPA